MAERKEIAALKTALLLEKQGKLFYQRVAKDTGSRAVAGLFEIMATAGLAVVGFSMNYLVGVVVGALIASGLTLALSATIAIRLCGFRFPIVDTARIALATTVMGLVVHSIDWPHTALGLVGATLIGGLSYVLALAAVYYRHLPPLVGLITAKIAGTRP